MLPWDTYETFKEKYNRGWLIYTSKAQGYRWRMVKFQFEDGNQAMREDELIQGKQGEQEV